MDEINSPITSIPGFDFRMVTMILAEAGDFSRFNSPDKLLAYTEISPSTYQSRQLKSCYPHIEKRGSHICTTPFIKRPSMSVTGNLAKKRTEGKHDNIVLFHAAKKLILSIVSALLYSFCAICFDHFHSFSGLTFNSQSFFLYCYFDYVY